MYDVNGNVMEVVEDTYFNYYYENEAILLDPFHQEPLEDNVGRGGALKVMPLSIKDCSSCEMVSFEQVQRCWI